MQPEEAEAFRQDRIFNAKQTLVPKIRNLEVIDESIGLEGLFWCQKRIERWDGYWRKKTQLAEKKVETGGRKNVYYKRMIAKRSITCGSKKLVKVALRSPELMQSHWRAVLPFVQGKYYQKLEGPCPSISKDMTKMTLRCIWLFQKSNIFRYQRRKGDGITPMYAVCPLCQNLGGRGLRDDLILQVEIEVRYLRQFHSSKVFFLSPCQSPLVKFI